MTTPAMATTTAATATAAAKLLHRQTKKPKGTDRDGLLLLYYDRLIALR